VKSTLYTFILFQLTAQTSIWPANDIIGKQNRAHRKDESELSRGSLLLPRYCSPFSLS